MRETHPKQTLQRHAIVPDLLLCVLGASHELHSPVTCTKTWSPIRRRRHTYQVLVQLLKT